MSTYSKLLKCSVKINEKRDCAVKAVAAATGARYNDVWQMMFDFGRPPRGYTPNTVTYNVLSELNFGTVNVTDQFHGKTVLTLGREMKNVKGAFLVWVSGHLLCIKDGEVCDWTNGRRHRIVKIVKVVHDTQHQTAARSEA